MEELAKGPISCGVWGEQNRQFFLTATDEVTHKLGEKIEIISTPEEAVSYYFSLIPVFQNLFFSS